MPAPTATTGYAANSNLLSYTDAVNGPWTFTYDTLNRLTAANSTSATGSFYYKQSGCWQYDGFGNRTKEAFPTLTTTPCA